MSVKWKVGSEEFTGEVVSRENGYVVIRQKHASGSITNLSLPEDEVEEEEVSETPAS